MMAAYAILLALVLLVVLAGICVYAAMANAAATEQIDRDAIARHIKLLQSQEGQYLHLRNPVTRAIP